MTRPTAMAPDASTSPVGYTSGPLHVQQDSEWPFTIRICVQTGEAIHSEPLACSSTRWKSLEDARDLVGIRGADRQEWKDAMDRQMADIHLRAAAPELLEVLEEALANIEAREEALADEEAFVERARAAIAKARGEVA